MKRQVMKRLLVAGLIAMKTAVATAGGYPLFVESTKEEDGVWAVVAHNAGTAPVYISIDLKNRQNVRVGGLSTAGQKALEPGAKETILLAIAENPAEQMSFEYETRWVFGRGQARGEHTGLYRPPFPADLTFESNNSSGDEQIGARTKNSIDILMPEGTPVVAARSGYVMDVSGSRGGDKIKGAWPYYEDGEKLGSYVRIVHEDGTWGEYAHLKQGSVTVRAGQKVEAGTQIGESGATGAAKRPHLEFTVLKPQQGFNEPISLPIRMELPGRGIVSVKAGDTMGASFSVAPEPETTRNDPLVIAAVKKGNVNERAGVYSAGLGQIKEEVAWAVGAGLAAILAMIAGGIWAARKRRKVGSWRGVWKRGGSEEASESEDKAELPEPEKTSEEVDLGREIDLRPKKGYMMAEWERHFYSVMSLAMPLGYAMHAKVCVNRLVARPTTACQRPGALAILRGASVDAAIVRERDGKIAAVVEIERDYGRVPDQEEAEQVKVRLLEGAGIKVLKVKKEVGPSELKQLLARVAPNETGEVPVGREALRAA